MQPFTALDSTPESTGEPRQGLGAQRGLGCQCECEPGLAVATYQESHEKQLPGHRHAEAGGWTCKESGELM